MVKYPEFVDEDKIECYPKNKNYRYYLIVDFIRNIEESEKIAMIIMQNPSEARKGQSDKTVNRVLKYLYGFGYSSVIITNVIPFYGTKIDTVLEIDFRNKKILDKNCKIIRKKSNVADKIFVAWGWIKPKKLSKELSKELSKYYEERINDVKKCLGSKKLYCYCKNKRKKQPRHPLVWKNGKKEDDFIRFV